MTCKNESEMCSYEKPCNWDCLVAWNTAKSKEMGISLEEPPSPVETQEEA